jgi:hypothetical protein
MPDVTTWGTPLSVARDIAARPVHDRARVERTGAPFRARIAPRVASTRPVAPAAFTATPPVVTSITPLLKTGQRHPTASRNSLGGTAVRA